MPGPFRCGVVHYASFPKCRDDEATFWASLETLLADRALGAIELHTFLQPNWLKRISRAIAGPSQSLLLSAGPQLLDEEGICAVNRTARRSAVELCKCLIDMAKQVSAASLMVISGKDPGPGQRTLAWAALEESLDELCDYARLDAPLTVSLETFARSSPPYQLVGPTVEAAAFADRMNQSHKNFRLTVDLSHLAQLGENPVASVERLGARVRHVHLSTCAITPGQAPAGDFHLSFNSAGVSVTLQDAKRALAAAASSSPHDEVVVSVEIRPQAGEDASQVFERSRRDLLSTVEAAIQLMAIS
jgi:sugar phosphate isomerase/epimerase